MTYTIAIIFRLDGRVVMQRPAKPFTPVRFRLQPPISEFKRFIFKLLVKYRLNSPGGGIGRHKGLKIPR